MYGENLFKTPFSEPLLCGAPHTLSDPPAPAQPHSPPSARVMKRLGILLVWSTGIAVLVVIVQILGAVVVVVVVMLDATASSG